MEQKKICRTQIMKNLQMNWNYDGENAEHPIGSFIPTNYDEIMFILRIGQKLTIYRENSPYWSMATTAIELQDIQDPYVKIRHNYITILDSDLKIILHTD